MPPDGLGLQMQGGTLQNIPPGASLQQQINALNDVINTLNALLKTQVFSDGSVKRMLFGYQKDGWGSGKNFGIKISTDGVDVTKASHAQLLFSMDLETWQWFDPKGGRNFVNIGNRTVGTYGFEMSKPGVALDDPND
jgi:hypothetical protein